MGKLDKIRIRNKMNDTLTRAQRLRRLNRMTRDSIKDTYRRGKDRIDSARESLSRSRSPSIRREYQKGKDTVTKVRESIRRSRSPNNDKKDVGTNTMVTYEVRPMVPALKGYR